MLARFYVATVFLLTTKTLLFFLLFQTKFKIRLEKEQKASGVKRTRANAATMRAETDKNKSATATTIYILARLQ